VKAAAFTAAARLELDLLQLELGRLRERRLRDREILDREARRVEEGDVAGAPAAIRLADEHGAELGDRVLGDDAGGDSGSELAAVACLLPVVAEEVRARELGDRDLGLAGPSAPMSETC
jgi:hypothetical protein